MNKKRLMILFALLLCLLINTNSATAAESDSISEVSKSNITRSVDTSFDLDFSESSTWTFKFDNEAGWFHFNHTHVDVYYDGYTEASYAPSVTLKLQELVDGTYETVETTTITLGKTKTFELPNGGKLTDYRLSFSANSKATCTFSVTSYKG